MKYLCQCVFTNCHLWCNNIRYALFISTWFKKIKFSHNLHTKKPSISIKASFNGTYLFCFSYLPFHIFHFMKHNNYFGIILFHKTFMQGTNLNIRKKPHTSRYTVFFNQHSKRRADVQPPILSCHFICFIFRHSVVRLIPSRSAACP